MRTLLYSSTDPAAARRAVVVSVPSSDVITYQAESVGDNAWSVPTPQVRWYGKTNPAGNEEYIAVCSRCGAALDVEIEEL